MPQGMSTKKCLMPTYFLDGFARKFSDNVLNDTWMMNMNAKLKSSVNDLRKHLLPNKLPKTVMPWILINVAML